MKRKINHADDITGAAVDLASQSGIPVVQQAAQALKVISNIAGGVSQDRFFDRYFEIKKILGDQGYTIKGPTHDNLLTKYQIRKTQVADKKKTGTYAPEFERLRQWVIAVLNLDSPGLGDYYASKWPAFVMANKGQMKGEPIQELKELVSLYPAGTYKPTFKQMATSDMKNKMNGQVITDNAKSLAESKAEEMALLGEIRPVMEAGLRANGSIPEKNLEDLATQFYNEIVAKSTSNFQRDNLDEAVTNAILTFIATIQAKKQSGEQLNPVYEKIANVTTKVQDKVQEQVKRQTGNTIGNWIVDNPVLSVVILLVVALILAKLFKVF